MRMNQKKGRYSIALVIFLMIPLAVLQGCVLRQQQVQEKGTQAAQKPSQGQQAPSSPPLTAEEGVVQKEKPAVEQQQKEPTIEQPAEIPSSESLIVGTVRPAPTTTAVRQPTTKEGETERPVKFSRQYELETLTLDSYKLERISRDKGEVTEVTFTVRNTGNKKLSPQVTLWFKTQEADSIQGMQEKTYDLPALEPGYKVTKTAH